MVIQLDVRTNAISSRISGTELTEELEEMICDVETNVTSAFMKCKCFEKKIYLVIEPS